MSISTDVLVSILSMDAYNRGYNAAISDGIGVLDGDGNDVDGLGEAGSAIGGATIVDIDLPAGSESAGFYAVAYQAGNEIVISYRGTDDFGGELFDTDIIDIIINGDITNPQFSLAVEFYSQVKQLHPTAELTLTGHSLGGALAA